MDDKLTRQLLYGLFLLFVIFMFKRAEAEQPLNVAVAANFAPAMELIRDEFSAETGVPVQLTISSSGRLFTQIKNRAPFDLYFSADSERPEILYNEEFCMEPDLYATGKVVLWSMSEKLCSVKEWKDVLLSPEVKKIAIANPDTAPYGAVAKQACRQLDDWPYIEQKFVYGTNVGQAFQYAQIGAVQVSFVALSLALSEKGKPGCFWEIPESISVGQKACVIAYGPNTVTAGRFLQHVTSSQTASVRKKFGYQ